MIRILAVDQQPGPAVLCHHTRFNYTGAHVYAGGKHQSPVHPPPNPFPYIHAVQKRKDECPGADDRGESPADIVQIIALYTNQADIGPVQLLDPVRGLERAADHGGLLGRIEQQSPPANRLEVLAPGHEIDPDSLCFIHRPVLPAGWMVVPGQPAAEVTAYPANPHHRYSLRFAAG